MKRPVRRLLVTLVALVCLTFGSATPASAGTLTAATFTAPASWVATGASNSRYDWGFTTATSATLSKVTASVPTGTGGKGRYLSLSGASGNYASTPSSAANQPGTALDIRVKAALDDWTFGCQFFAAKRQGVSLSYALRTTQCGGLGLYGGLELVYSENGTQQIKSYSSATVPFSARQSGWIRATINTNEAGSTVTRFFTSSDGNNWVALGTPVTQAGTTTFYNGPEPISVGGFPDNLVGQFTGRIYYAEVRNGIGGPVVNKFDPNEAAAQSSSSWSASTGEAWTVNRSGTNMPADIASDLNVGPVEGLPSGGTANYRFIDGVATYNLPSPTSVNAGMNVKLNLGGFTNTATPGSYTSTIRTHDNAGTPAVVDSATTSALEFSETSNTTSTNIVVDPSLTFTVAGDSGSCNGISASPGASASATAVSLGRISSSQPGTAVQRLTVSTNGEAGAIVSTRPSGTMSANSATIPHIAGYRIAFPSLGTAGFGVSMDWYSTDQWTGLSNSLSTSLFNTPSAGQGTHCIALRAQPAANSPAGNYTTSLRYIATPRY